MDFYTTILKEDAGYWVALCLENGITGQGATKDEAVRKLKEAVDSFEEVRKEDPDVYTLPVSIKELHEFLTFEHEKTILGPLELRAVYA